jgi:RNA-directed DNA polymerase
MHVEDLFRAYFDARKHKRSSSSAIAFEVHYERNLFALWEDLLSGRYRIGPSVCFIAFHPVQREIFAAGFRDRIVHHLLYNYVNPIFERLFIEDCYSCRKGKGTSYGIRRADHFIRSCSENYSRDCYVLKLDIEGYFMAIDRTVLFTKVHDTVTRYRRDIACDHEFLVRLLRQVIFHDPTRHCQVRGRREDWTGLPKSKSLFFAGGNKGLPIGNLTSQLFGNVYLNDFDHFMKCKLGCRFYGRYVDDMFVIHRDAGVLKELVPVVRRQLRETVGLAVHERKVYLQHYSKGMPFLGAFIKPYCLYVGRRTKGAFYRSLRQWNAALVQCIGEPPPAIVRKLLCSTNSYLGMLKQFRTYRLRRKMLESVLCERWHLSVQPSPDYGKVVAICGYDMQQRKRR